MVSDPNRKQNWSISVLERDDYTCQECGSLEHPQAHHIVPVSENDSKALDINNGITLCRECHKKAHRGNIGPMKCITYRIEYDKLFKLKQYCTDSNVSIQRLLDTYITTLLSKPEEVLPAEKKIPLEANQIPATKETTKPNTENESSMLPKSGVSYKLFHCPHCGENITDMVGSDRLFHLQNCKNKHNR